MKDHETGEVRCACGEYVFCEGGCLCEEIISQREQIARQQLVLDAARSARDAYFDEEKTDTLAILARAMVYLSKQLRTYDGEVKP